MGLINKDTFVCIDCESTGLDAKNDRIIELAAVSFTFDKNIESFETLVNPECLIPLESQKVHNITEKMVQGQPSVDKVLRKLFHFINNHTLIGHGIAFDISIIANEAKRHNIPCNIENALYLDTLRMARLYGDSPINSLEKLRQHFNIQNEGAHRAMSDVIVNIEVFKHLAKGFRTTEELFHRLKSPIALKTMPLGKHKGRRFQEIPIEYLQWASHKDFDQDLLFSIRIELKNRKKGSSFNQATNPFSLL